MALPSDERVRPQTTRPGQRDVARLRLVRQGDLDTIWSAWQARFLASGARLNDTQGTLTVSRRDVEIVNELGPIVDARIQAVPLLSSFEPDATDDKKAEDADPEDGDSKGGSSRSEAESFAEDLNAWASSSDGDSLDLFSAWREVIDDQEGDGVAAVVMGLRDGEPWFEVRDTVGLTVQAQKLNPRKPESISFHWCEVEPNAKGDPQEIKHEERFTAMDRVRLADGKIIEEEPHGLGVIPVVLIPRRRTKGVLIPAPGTAELEEAQLNYLWSRYLLNAANKYEAHGLYCTDPADERADMLPTGGANAGMSKFKTSPGALVPIGIQKVGGSINTQTLQAQCQMNLDSLRRIGKVREQGAGGTADMRSGKAMLVGSEEMRGYIAEKLVFLRAGARRIATLWGILTGRLQPGDTAPVVPVMETEDDQDPAEATKRGEFWLKVRTAGECTSERFYIETQRNGLLDEDADPAAIAAEVEAEQAEDADRLAAQMIEAAKAAKPAGKDDEKQDGPTGPPMPPPNGAGKAVMTDG